MEGTEISTIALLIVGLVLVTYGGLTEGKPAAFIFGFAIIVGVMGFDLHNKYGPFSDTYNEVAQQSPLAQFTVDNYRDCRSQGWFDHPTTAKCQVRTIENVAKAKGVSEAKVREILGQLKDVEKTE